MQKALQRPDSGLIAPTKTKPAIHWNDLPLEVREAKIEKTRKQQGRKDRNPQVILEGELEAEMKVNYRSTYTYLDDAYTVANNFSDFKKAILMYLIDCSNSGFLLNAEKIHFGVVDGVGQAIVLGYEIENKTIKPKSSQIDPLLRLTPPKTVKGMMRFLGIINYLSSHIDSTTLLAKPLYDKIAGKNKKETIKLDAAEIKIFESLKERAANPAALYLPSREDALYLAVDASNVGVGAVLMAVSESNEVKVVGYFSKLFPPAVRKVESSIVKEAAGVLIALHHYRFFIHSHEVTLLSDCKALVALLVYSRSTSSPPLFRMVTRIREYPLSYLHHVPGQDMIVADALSRVASYTAKTPEVVLKTKWREIEAEQVSPIPANRILSFRELEEYVHENGQALVENKIQIPEIGDNLPLPGEEFRENNLHNSVIKNVDALKLSRRVKVHRIDSTTPVPAARKLRNPFDENLTGITRTFLLEGQARDQSIRNKIQTLQTVEKVPPELTKFKLLNGVMLCREGIAGDRIILSDEMLPKVGAAFHACGHISMRKLNRTVQKFFVLPSQGKQIIDNIVRCCHFCQMYKSLQFHDYKDGKPVRGLKPMQHLVIDHIILNKPYYTFGKPVKCILSVVDTFSGFTWAFTQTGATTSNVIRDLLTIRSSFGPFQSITVDNGTAFTSKTFCEFAQENNVKIYHTLPYSSSGAGIVENKNRQLRDNLAIRMRESGTRIDSALATVVFFLNNNLRKDSTSYRFTIRPRGDTTAPLPT